LKKALTAGFDQKQMDERVTGKDIIRFFNIGEHTLFRYIQLGLPVYDDSQERIRDWNYFEPFERDEKSIFKTTSSILSAFSRGCENILTNDAPNNPSPKLFFKTPSDEEAEKNAMLKMVQLWFDKGEVRKFIKDKNKMDMESHNGYSMPAYRESNHRHFCKELEIAIKAWIALFEEGEYSEGKKSPKKQIRQWLDKNYQDKKDSDKNYLSKNAKDRITTIINPDHKGGAPNSDY
jgi:hypothetical protein